MDIVVCMGSSQGYSLDCACYCWCAVRLRLPHNLRTFSLASCISSTPFSQPLQPTSPLTTRTAQLSSIIYLIDVYGPEFGASALAATGVLRFLFSGAFPLFTLQMYQKLGIHWAGSVFGFIALAMLPVPWVFFKWGKEMRQRSTFVPVLMEKI